MCRTALGSVLALLLTLGLSGCQESNTPSAPGIGGGNPVPPPGGGSGGTGGVAGGGGTAGSGGGGASGGGGGGGAAGGNGGAGGVGGFATPGACANDGDFRALASLEANGQNAREEAAGLALPTSCGGIPNAADFVDCVAAGMQALFDGDESLSLSGECSLCYGELAACSIVGACNFPCSLDACNPVACRQCPGYPACENDLDLCTGTTPPECGET